MPSQLAAELATRWQIPVPAAPGTMRYSAPGNWYHGLASFPGALLDRDGYVVFETEGAYRSCPQLKIGRKGDVGVPRGIRAIPGYVRASAASNGVGGSEPTPPLHGADEHGEPVR